MSFIFINQNPDDLITDDCLPESTMEATPAAVEEFFNVSATDNILIRCGCCQTLTVTNTSTIPVTVSDANIIISK